MYLKLGQYEICNSESDGITQMLNVVTPKLAKVSDSVHPLGSTNPTHFQRKGVSRSVEINVIRNFYTYREAEVWVAEHMGEMERLREYGDLDFESMLGVGYLYGSASLVDVEVVSANGVSVEIKYTFNAGRAITFYGVTVEINGVECLVSAECDQQQYYPMVRVAKG